MKMYMTEELSEAIKAAKSKDIKWEAICGFMKNGIEEAMKKMDERELARRVISRLTGKKEDDNG